MQLHSQPYNQTFLSWPALGSRVSLECICCQVLIPKFLLLMVAPHAASVSPQHHCQRTHSPQPNARELQGIPKQEGKGGGREGRGKSLNLDIYLLKHRKEHTSRHHCWQKSQQSGLWSFASSKDFFAWSSTGAFSPSHRSELRSALHCQPQCISALMQVEFIRIGAGAT